MSNFSLKTRIIASLAGAHIFGNPSGKLKIIGITGTNGKTTTATLLYKVATALGYKAGLIGTVENIIINEVRPTIHTTPSPIELNKLLKEMANLKCDYVFMEVSSHAIDQKRIAGINFAGGVFTNITHDHLDYHKNFEGYFKAKKRFFDSLPKGSFALTNTNDGYGKKIIEDTKASKFSYGFYDLKSEVLGVSSTKREDFHGEVKKSDFSGLELEINGDKLNSKLIGNFNAYNILAAWATCHLLSFDMEKVRKALEEATPPRGRFDYFVSKGGVMAIVDFAHTPDALEKVLTVIKELKNEKSKIISVFGCGGERDTLKRPVMGKIGAILSDVAIFSSDNPRSEDPEKIIEEMKKELTADELNKVKSIADRSEAIAEAVKLAKSGDVILCAGKGHETFQAIKGKEIHFNDTEELRKLLN